MDDSPIRAKLVQNVVFSKTQATPFGSVGQKKSFCDPQREFVDPKVYKSLHKTATVIQFAKMKGRGDDYKVETEEDKEKRRGKDAAVKKLMRPRILGRKGDTLPHVDKKKVEEIAKGELEVFQRFLIYLYNENR